MPKGLNRAIENSLAGRQGSSDEFLCTVSSPASCALVRAENR